MAGISGSGQNTWVDVCPCSGADLADVCKSKIHPDTVDAAELSNCEGVELEGDFHDGLVVFAKFGLSVGRSVCNGPPDVIQV